MIVRSVSIWLSAIMFGWAPCLFGAANQEPDPTKLAEVGEASFQRFATNTAVWELKIPLPNNAEISVRCLSSTDGQRWTALSRGNGKTVPLFDIIERNDLWHVREGDKAIKCRPYEATLSFPSAYLFLDAAAPVFVAEPSMLKDAKYDGVFDQAVRYRIEVPPDYRQLLEKTLLDSRRIGAEKPDFWTNEQRANVAWIEAALAKGVPIEIDRETALIRTRVEQNLRLEITRFEWLPKVPANALKLPEIDWKDASQPLADDDWSEVVVVAHDSWSGKTSRKASPDSHFFNLKTGEMRRVPFTGKASIPLGFLADRTEALFFGYSVSEGPEVVLIDATAGECSSLEIEGLAGAVPINGAISHDKKQLALVTMSGKGRLLDLQIYLVDLDSMAAKPLGIPSRIGGPIGWLPDGTGLVLKRIGEPSGDGQIEKRILCRMAMDGTLTDLREGGTPTVLPKSKRILFEDTASREWFTCDFDGLNSRKFGHGMSGFGAPAVSPDEKEILWVKYQSDSPPRVHRFKFEAAEGKPISDAPGFFALPFWR